MKHTVSVLIPAYNAVNWIKQSIESALDQSSPVEVIVVDDGSTDGTADIISSFGSKVRFELGPNRGAPAARNRLLSLSRTEWVQYLDADDYLNPHKIKDQLVVVKNDDDVDVVFGPEIIEWHNTIDVTTSQVEIPQPHDIWTMLALWQLPQTGAPLWKKQALLEVGAWNEKQPCCQEHELYLRLLVAGKKFVYQPKNGAVYRRFRSGTLSTNNPSLVRAERAKILNRLESHLVRSKKLTTNRQWAVNQARFQLARSAWTDDAAEARRYHSSITGNFVPRGPSAPILYRIVYIVGGFSFAEKIAHLLRSKKHWRASKN